MTDLQMILAMLSKTNHDYTKRTIEMVGGDKHISVTLANGVEFHFHKDGRIHYISKKLEK